MSCADPTVRALTLLHAGDGVVVSAAPGRQACAAIAPRGDLLLVLLPPGPVSLALRRGAQLEAHLAAVQQTAGCEGRLTREHGRLTVAGRLRAVADDDRLAAALQMWREHPMEQLLDAAAPSVADGSGWQLAHLAPTSVCWQLADGRVPLEPAAVLRSEPDRVLGGSLALCRHLNSGHPEVAAHLAGPGAWFAEVDAGGATFGLPGDDDHYLRLPWAEPCPELADVQRVLASVSCGPVR